MPEVSITINGRIYQIGCDDGQEQRVVELASYIDQKLQKIARAGAAHNDAHLLVLTGLVLADELFEAKNGGGSKSSASGAKAAATNGSDTQEIEKALARTLEDLAERIDGIAARVKAA